LPVVVPWNLVAAQEARARGERSGSSISNRDSILVNTVHVWAGYRQAKTIYEIEPRFGRLPGASPLACRNADCGLTPAIALPGACCPT
jgi:hypothetical protein